MLSVSLKLAKILPFIPLDVSPHHHGRVGVKFITSVMVLKRAISPDTRTIYGIALALTITFPRVLFPRSRYWSSFSIKLMLGNILLDQPPDPCPSAWAPSFPFFLARFPAQVPSPYRPLLTPQKIYLFPKPVADHSALGSPLLRSLLALAPLFLGGRSIPPPSPAV